MLFGIWLRGVAVADAHHAGRLQAELVRLGRGSSVRGGRQRLDVAATSPSASVHCREQTGMITG
jgi:hypothetical protein